jgi:hypothetical protein
MSRPTSLAIPRYSDTPDSPDYRIRGFPDSRIYRTPSALREPAEVEADISKRSKTVSLLAVIQLPKYSGLGTLLSLATDSVRLYPALPHVV